MKKIFGLVVMAMSMLFAANAMASTSVESVTAVTSVADYEGDYVGQISNVTMNGKSYDPESATFTLEGNVFTPVFCRDVLIHTCPSKEV